MYVLLILIDFAFSVTGTGAAGAGAVVRCAASAPDDTASPRQSRATQSATNSTPGFPCLAIETLLPALDAAVAVFCAAGIVVVTVAAEAGGLDRRPGRARIRDRGSATAAAGRSAAARGRARARRRRRRGDLRPDAEETLHPGRGVPGHRAQKLVGAGL